MKNLANAASKITNLPTFRAFRYGNFTLVFFSSITNSLGHLMSMAALGWLVPEMTDSALSLGIVWAVYSSPSLLFGVLAGSLADRFNRRFLLVLSNVILAAFAFLLGFLITQGRIEFWHILSITFLMGVFQVIYIPASQSLAVDIVGRKGTMNAM